MAGPIAAAAPVAAPTTDGVAAPAQPVAGSPAAAWGHGTGPAPASRRSPIALLAAVGGAIVLIVVAGLFFAVGRESAETAGDAEATSGAAAGADEGEPGAAVEVEPGDKTEDNVELAGSADAPHADAGADAAESEVSAKPTTKAARPAGTTTKGGRPRPTGQQPGDAFGPGRR